MTDLPWDWLCVEVWVAAETGRVCYTEADMQKMQVPFSPGTKQLHVKGLCDVKK